MISYQTWRIELKILNIDNSIVEEPKYNDRFPIDFIKEENFEVLLKAYEPLIKNQIKLSYRYYANHAMLEYDDLYSEASIALWKTIKSFDPTMGIYFGVYLKQCIYNQIRSYAKTYLPHYYVKDFKKTYQSGKPAFTRVNVIIYPTDFSEGTYDGKYGFLKDT